MAFTTTPAAAPRRVGRGLRIVAAGVVVLVGLGLVGQVWWKDFWSSEEAPEESTVRPARAKLEDYRVDEPPSEEEVVPATVTVTKPPPQQREVPERQPRLTRMSDRPREPIQIGDVAWNVTATEIPNAGFYDGRQPLQGEGCTLRVGQALIPGRLLDAVYSEIGGQVIAEVMTAIHSSDIGYTNKVLVPQGTRIVGHTVGNQELTLDRGRLGIVWTQMSHPNGFGGNLRYTRVSLGEAGGGSADGSAGLGGKVELHWGKIFMYAALVTIFNVAQREAFEDNDYADEAASTTGRLGEEILERSLDFKPKIAINAGTPVQIKINNDTRVC